MLTMQMLWNELESWLRVHASSVYADLKPGATERQIEETERILGFSFPDDVRESYRIHDGQSRSGPCLINGHTLLSSNDMISEWKCWKNLLDSGAFATFESTPSNPNIRGEWYDSGWIPITYDGSGNHICFDLHPQRKNCRGQIITLFHDSDERDLLASSWHEYLESYLKSLEAGEFVYSKRADGIIAAEDDI